MTSAAQVSRLLALVPYLQANPNAELAKTAAVFGVSPRQLVADLEVLWYCGLPGGLPGDLIEVDMDAVEAEGRIRLTNAEYLSRPMRFSLDEAMSLVVALRAVRELAGTELTPAVDSALAKLTGVVDGGGVDVALTVASGASEVRDVLNRAIEERLAVRLTYDTTSRTTSPVVEPHRLSVRDGYGYLEAWSRDRDGWRTYRLDRIATAEATGEPATDHGPTPEFSASWLEQREGVGTVVLDVDTRSTWITEYYPVRSITRNRRGAKVELLVADPGWLTGLLLQLGGGVRRVDPPEAAESAAEAAAEALALYEAWAEA